VQSKPSQGRGNASNTEKFTKALIEAPLVLLTIPKRKLADGELTDTSESSDDKDYEFPAMVVLFNLLSL